MWTPKVAGAYYAALCFFFGGRVIGGVADPSLLPLRPGFGSSPRAVDSPGGGVIQKTAFSNNTRMIFIAGLEGSGHHFVNNVFQAVCESRSVECPDVCAIADIWFSTLAEFNSTSEYEKGRERLRSEMGTLALTAERLRTEGSSDASVATFHHCGNEVGEMSYPNWDGNDKPLQYVDLRILAEEAEGAGIDLRVIYLSRPAEEIMISTTEHRDFGSFEHEARVLINAASVLGSSLRELDPDFITCFSYENSSSPAQASRVAEFLMPTTESATLLAQTLLAKAHADGRVEANHSDGWELISDRLQQKVDEIDRDQC